MTAHVAGTEPYAWPYDGRLGGDHLALVLAGWDDAWAGRCAATGELAAIQARIATLATAVERWGGLVVPLAHAGGRPLATVALDPVPVAAFGIDGFHGSALDALLRAHGRTHLLVAGHGIEGPVHSTLRSANDRGYECLLVADACSSLTDDLAGAAVKTVTMSGGIFGAVGTTGAVLAALHALPDPVTAQEA